MGLAPFTLLPAARGRVLWRKVHTRNLWVLCSKHPPASTHMPVTFLLPPRTRARAPLPFVPPRLQFGANPSSQALAQLARELTLQARTQRLSKQQAAEVKPASVAASAGAAAGVPASASSLDALSP